MMLLGLVLHSCVSYLPFHPPEIAWIYQDAQTSAFLGWLFAFIHIFRMPVFFVIAGFFAAYLQSSRGTRAFLRHRLSRVGIPLVYGWLIIYPLTIAGVFYVQFATASLPVLLPTKADKSLFDQIIQAGANIKDFLVALHFELDLLHLWFLYQLLIFCLAAVLIRRLTLRLPAAVRDRVLDTFKRGVHRTGTVVLLAVLSSVMLWPMELWHFDPASSLLPPWHVLGGYGLFFAFGWLVFERRDVVAGFKARASIHFAAGFFCHVGYLFFYDQGYEAYPGKPLMTLPLYAFFAARGLSEAAAVGTHVGAMLFLALAVWFLMYGFLGLFLCYLEKPSPGWRYMSDASYWMYIVHPPLVLVLPTLLADYALPAWVKASLVLSATTLITLVTYHYGVRATFMGKRLNGRRYPRIVPWREAATERKKRP